jgi:primosomal protein N'
MGLAEWMAQYYLAPLGEVLRGMLPLMAEVRRTVYYRITDLGRDVLAKRVERGRPEQKTKRRGGGSCRQRRGSGAAGVDAAGRRARR